MSKKSTVVGFVEDFEGQFYTIDKNGKKIELQNGDEITEGMVIVGDESNPETAQIKISSDSGDSFVLDGVNETVLNSDFLAQNFGASVISESEDLDRGNSEGKDKFDNNHDNRVVKIDTQDNSETTEADTIASTDINERFQDMLDGSKEESEFNMDIFNSSDSELAESELSATKSDEISVSDMYSATEVGTEYTIDDDNIDTEDGVDDGINLSGSLIAGKESVFEDTASSSLAGEELYYEDDVEDEFIIETDAGDDVVILGDDLSDEAVIDTGDGDDTVIVGDNVEDRATIDTGDGDDTVIVNDLKDDSNIDLGDGDDTLIVKEDVNLDSGIVTGGDGVDSLVLEDQTEDDWDSEMSSRFQDFESVTFSDGTVLNLIEATATSESEQEIRLVSINVDGVDYEVGDESTEIVLPHGTLVVNQNGDFNFVVDNDNTEVQSLNIGDSLDETFSYTLSNGIDTFTSSVNINIDGRDDAPVIEYTIASDADSLENSILKDISITDVDNTTLENAYVSIDNYKDGDIINVGELPDGITATLSGADLVLSGTATLADYEAALKSLTFETTSEDTTSREFVYTVFDGVKYSNVESVVFDLESGSDVENSATTCDINHFTISTPNEHDISHIDLYIKTADSDIIKIKIDDFQDGFQSVTPASFIRENYPESELIAYYVKAGDNFSIDGIQNDTVILNDNYSLYDLPVFNHAFDELTLKFNKDYNETYEDVYDFSDYKIALTQANVDAKDDMASILENTTTIISAESLLSNDTDMDGDILTITKVEATDATHGVVSLNENGDVVYTSEIDYVGAASFTYTIMDADGSCDTATVNLNIENGNEAPVISALVANEQCAYTVDGLLDADGDGVADSVAIGDILAVNGYADPIKFNEDNGNITINVGNTNSSASIEYYGSNAGYNNVLGFYEKDADGNITDVKILYVDKTEGFENFVNEPLNLGTINDLNGDIGFFLIPDGYSKAEIQNAIDNGYDLSIDSDNKIVFTNPNDSSDTVSPINTYYTDNNMSTDGRDHAIITINPDGGLTIGMEDLSMIGTDSDYDDVVFSIKPCTSISEDNTILNNINISDVDDANLEGASVAILNYKDGDVIDANSIPSGITAVISGGFVELSGSASVADYKLALESLTFETTSGDRTPREIVFTVFDGDVHNQAESITLDIGGCELNVYVPDNYVPIAVSDMISVQEDEVTVISASSIVANDIDGDNDALSIVSVEATENTHGTVSLNENGDVIFIPDANYNGVATFAYTVTDGNLTDALTTTRTATVTLNIESVNDAPIAFDEQTDLVTGAVFDTSGKNIIEYSDENDQYYNIDSAAGEDRYDGTLLRDDAIYSKDGHDNIQALSGDDILIDGDGFSQLQGNDGDDILYGGAGNDILYGGDGIDTGVYDGKFSDYTIEVLNDTQISVKDNNYVNGWEGIDKVYSSGVNAVEILQFADGQYNISTGTFVEGAFNSRITYNNGEISTMDVTVIEAYKLLSNDTDIDGDSLRIVEVSATEETHGTVVIDESGNLIFTPEANYNGVASFTYTVSDGELTSQASVSLNVETSDAYNLANSFEAEVDSVLNEDIDLYEDDYVVFNLEDGINLDFSDENLEPLSNIDEINMQNGSANSIDALTLDDVLEMTDENNTLTIMGDDVDSLNINKDGWELNSESNNNGINTYEYSNGNGDIVVLNIEEQIHSTGM